MLNKKKIEKMSVVFVFFEKIFLSVKRKLIKKCDDDVLSRIKMCCKKKNTIVKMKKRVFTKNACWNKR